jgi:sarcosine/dimethylglycine N-methyltransferase|tara:strand:+ start:111 stop:965 length:855 start_codon:yes stop_codon:yes gene_type:complete
MNTNLNVKDMKLYTGADSIIAELSALGFGPRSPLNFNEVCKIDQLHYHGAASVQLAIDALAIKENSHVLEIGAGWGGPSRFIAGRTKAQVTALELQNDFNSVGESITKRCGLNSFVTHRQDDFLQVEFKNFKFEHIVSWLALYHIPNRKFFTEKMYGLMVPGGTIFIEDLIQGSAYKDADLEQLNKELFANSLVDENKYLDGLRAVGFEIISAENMASDWLEFTSKRLNIFLKNREKFIDLHGNDAFQGKKHFYSKIVEFFSDSFISGMRLVAKKIIPNTQDLS